jgi:primosomal replication protein N
MAVYEGVPSIRLEGDEERALALIPDAKALLYKVQNFKRTAGVNTFSMTQRMDDDSTIYVLSAMGQNVINISVAPHVPELLNLEEDKYDGTLFPDFYSGVVFRGYLEERTRTNPDGTVVRYGVCRTFAPTPTCARLNDELSGGRQEVARLAVRPWVAYDELNNKSPSGVPVFTQYTRLRSSMYSGTMKKVAQIAMGLGRIPKQKLRDPDQPKKPDTKYIKDVGSDGVQVRYDWRYMRTHGITRGADGTLWLVEISAARGVIARPLPVFPDSTTDGFRRRAERRGDTAMVTALDELGCLPTGEAFPNTNALVEEQIEAGNILRLLAPSDLSDFYRCSPYSSAMGWAFNERGSEAHNTGYYFGEDGFQRGVWYQINIQLGAIRTRRKPKEPIATGSAVLRKNTEGFLYCPPARSGSYARYIPIKFHEPFLPGLLSHEGVPTVEAAGKPPPRVDTPMFVAFHGDELKVVRYFRNPKQDTFENVDDPRFPGECLLAGSWTVTETSGSRSFPNMLYSNDFDDRKVLQEQVKTTEIVSTDLGYDPPKFSDFIESPETAYVWRERVFRRTTQISTDGGESVVSAVAIPQYSREAYYYATATSYTSRLRQTIIGFDYVRDPNVGYSWRCFPRINAPPFPPNRPDCNTTVCRGNAPCSLGGRGFPKERRIVCTAYEPRYGGDWVFGGGPGANCHEFADSGDWLQICQIVDGFNSPAPNRQASITTTTLPVEGDAKLFLMSPGYGGPLAVPVTHSQVVNHWMTPSPEPVTQTVQFIYATHSAIGSDMIVYSTNLSTYAGEIRSYGYTPASINQDDGHPAFVGVNQP